MKKVLLVGSGVEPEALRNLVAAQNINVSEQHSTQHPQHAICPACNGARLVYQPYLDKTVECPTCDGTGKQQAVR